MLRHVDLLLIIRDPKTLEGIGMAEQIPKSRETRKVIRDSLSKFTMTIAAIADLYITSTFHV